MKTPSAALLLLLWAGLVVVAAEHKDLQEKSANTVPSQLIYQPDIHTVLREMSTLVAKLEVELRYTKTQGDDVETRLRTSEKTVEEFSQTVARLADRLKASENKAETMETRLRVSENLVERLKSENEALALDLNLTVSQVEELRREREETRVAFSASLVASGSVNKGPFSEATPLVYRHIYINTGNAYNPNTGVFTAPVRGVYYFVLHAVGPGHATRQTGVSLHKNSEHIVLAWSHQTNGYDSVSNGASLLLEVGDVVYVKLWPGSWVHDSHNHHTIFSGHLLFPM